MSLHPSGCKSSYVGGGLTSRTERSFQDLAATSLQPFNDIQSCMVRRRRLNSKALETLPWFRAPEGTKSRIYKDPGKLCTEPFWKECQNGQEILNPLPKSDILLDLESTL